MAVTQTLQMYVDGLQMDVVDHLLSVKICSLNVKVCVYVWKTNVQQGCYDGLSSTNQPLCLSHTHTQMEMLFSLNPISVPISILCPAFNN